MTRIFTHLIIAGAKGITWESARAINSADANYRYRYIYNTEPIAATWMDETLGTFIMDLLALQVIANVCTGSLMQ